MQTVISNSPSQTSGYRTNGGPAHWAPVLPPCSMSTPNAAPTPSPIVAMVTGARWMSASCAGSSFSLIW